MQNPYEILKDLTRGNSDITKKSLKNFIKKLPINESVKKELLSITPSNYLGNARKC